MCVCAFMRERERRRKENPGKSVPRPGDSLISVRTIKVDVPSKWRGDMSRVLCVLDFYSRL